MERATDKGDFVFKLISTSLLSVSLLLTGGTALAAPGVGEKVYGARVEAGLSEFEARYGRLMGKADDGEDGLVLEAAHGFSDRFYGAALVEFEREPGTSRRVEAIAVEGIYALGHIDGLGIDAALYGEYEVGMHGADKVETKLLLQKTVGGFDGRLNLIAEKALHQGERVEVGYVASADYAVVGDFRAGVAAFGELGDFHRFAPHAEHFVGPIVKTELEGLPGKGELEIETGYLFALDRARDDTRGQFRLLLEYEFHF